MVDGGFTIVHGNALHISNNNSRALELFLQTVQKYDNLNQHQLLVLIMQNNYLSIFLF